MPTHQKHDHKLSLHQNRIKTEKLQEQWWRFEEPSNPNHPRISISQQIIINSTLKHPIHTNFNITESSSPQNPFQFHKDLQKQCEFARRELSDSWIIIIIEFTLAIQTQIHHQWRQIQRDHEGFGEKRRGEIEFGTEPEKKEKSDSKSNERRRRTCSSARGNKETFTRNEEQSSTSSVPVRISELHRGKVLVHLPLSKSSITSLNVVDREM
jgi:hypothetical protein